MDRGNFIRGTVTSLFALRLSGITWAQKQASPLDSVSDQVKALYRRSLVLDALCMPTGPSEDPLSLKAVKSGRFTQRGPGLPAIFGMNFQAVRVGQKLAVLYRWA